jgi:quercetin dioxygenase-like cupin family protein
VSLPEHLKPYISRSDEHQRLDWIGNMELAVILDAAATGGQLTIVEITAKRGDASPVHVHSKDDEAFFVITGGMTVWVGDDRQELGAGSIGFLPRELPHAFRFDMDSRALTLTTPAGQEGFFRAAGWDLSQPKPEGWTISPESLKDAAAAHGTTVIGPPHGLDD